jgi:hypothetical protein
VAAGDTDAGREYLSAVPVPGGDKLLFIAGFVPGPPFGYEPLATCDFASSNGVAAARIMRRRRHTTRGTSRAASASIVPRS